MAELEKENEDFIIEFLQEQNFDLSEYNDFVNFIKIRGMFNSNTKIYNKMFPTKANLKKLYNEYNNPIKRICKILKITYSELGEKIGYKESAIKTIVSSNKISEPLKKTIDLLMENMELHKELEEINEKNKELEQKLIDIVIGLKNTNSNK